MGSQLDLRESPKHLNQPIIERTIPVGFLPCLRRGSDRWWLPRSERSTDALARLLLAETRCNDGEQIAPLVFGELKQALVADPALFIFTALSLPPCESVEVEDLAMWLRKRASGRFASGDAFLGAPNITSEMNRRWRRLTDHYQTLPQEQWLEDAHLWLEVTGPHVSNTWKEQWPILDVESRPERKSPVGNPTCFLQDLARQVQHQRSLEAAFDDRLHKSKLGALKQLAYGLSHEINNPLANISTRAEQLQRGESDPARKATLQRIIDQVYRAHEMIADLMFYANPPGMETDQADLKQIMRTIADNFREETERQAIRLEVASSEQPASLCVDATMVGEAIRALVRNSIDAIGCQGTIVLSLDHDGDQVRIHIADSGPGLSDHARAHAFDPYFSGREAGRGLGLGLCRAYRIAKLHHGEITLAGGPAGCVATISLSPIVSE